MPFDISHYMEPTQMRTANWFNVFDSEKSEWLNERGTWSKSYTEAAEFQDWDLAVKAAHEADPDAERTPAVLGDFGNANDY